MFLCTWLSFRHRLPREAHARACALRSGLAKMAVSAFGDSVVFATARGGLHCVDLVDLACGVTEVSLLFDCC